MGAGPCDGWLGIERTGPGRWGFELTEGLSRLDGKFFGGTGIAVATATMEAETGRRAAWVSVQYVASGATGDRFDCEVEVLAAGRGTSQLRVSGWHGDRLVFTGLGATGRPRAGALEWHAGTMPVGPPPEECPPWAPLAWFARSGTDGDAPPARPGWLGIADARAADDRGSMWMRIDGAALTRPALAFLADVVPSGVVRAAGRQGFGTSLDNTVRFGPEPDGDWVLVDVDPHMVSGGYVHGAARLWSASGRLLGIASQTASLVLLD